MHKFYKKSVLRLMIATIVARYIDDAEIIDAIVDDLCGTLANR